MKAKAIIDLLPGYGVTEKKTHSSSIPEDVAVKVRKHIQGASDADAAAEASAKAETQAKEAAAKAAHTRPAAVASAPAPVCPSKSRHSSQVMSFGSVSVSAIVLFQSTPKTCS